MSSILIVPGLNDSGPDHWQTWFEQRLAGTVRVEQEDWVTPHLPRWAGAVRRTLERQPGQVWIVAHSFGCLASVHAATDYPDKVAGLMLVAPADPSKFGVSAMLPDEHLEVPSVMVASTSDPWMTSAKAAYWADRWGSRLINIGAAGHINAESGYGAWVDGLEIFEQLRRAQDDFPLGPLDAQKPRTALASTRRGGSRSPRKQAIDWYNWLQEG